MCFWQGERASDKAIAVFCVPFLFFFSYVLFFFFVPRVEVGGVLLKLEIYDHLVCVCVCVDERADVTLKTGEGLLPLCTCFPFFSLCAWVLVLAGLSFHSFSGSPLRILSLIENWGGGTLALTSVVTYAYIYIYMCVFLVAQCRVCPPPVLPPCLHVFQQELEKGGWEYWLCKVPFFFFK